ncbi:MAG: hypothetical protein KQH67_08990 [Bacteroidetes bacterium]|nr:hypothetical protein [Bacteroidota bacterium]
MKRSDNFILLLCIIIAAFFWLLIKLSNSYDVSYTTYIAYENVPVEKRLTKIIDSSLVIGFKARGYDILKLNITENMKLLTLDLTAYQLKKANNDEYYINTGLIAQELANYININESDIFLSKSTLSFVLSDLHVKEIGVQGRLELGFKDQFDLYEKEMIRPKTVSVFGPLSVLDTMTNVYTEKLKLAMVNEDKSIQVKLYNPLPDILNIEPGEVNVQLRVERFTESSVEIEVDVSSLPENVRTFPSTVQVNFKVAQKDFSNIQSNQFKVIPDVGQTDLTSAKRLHLTLVEKPDFIRNEWITPTDVEFLIIK